MQGKKPRPILPDSDRVFRDVPRTFELRHTICHGKASAYEIEAAEVSRCFQGCVKFLRKADEFISETVHPGAPISRYEINVASGESLAEARCRLNEASQKVRQHLNTTELAA